MTKFASKDATLFAKAVRGHWDIEVMHWYLDVLFKEDSHKVLNKTAKNELKCIEKIALAILKNGHQILVRK